jgi:hypothetical protein
MSLVSRTIFVFVAALLLLFVVSRDVDAIAFDLPAKASAS